MLLLHATNFGKLYYLHVVQNILKFFLRLLWPMCYLEVYLIFWYFDIFCPPPLISTLLPETILCMISILLNLSCILWPRMWSLLVIIPCELEKNVLLDEVYKCELDPADWWMDGAELNSVLTDFLPAEFVNYWQRGIEISS